MRRYWPKGLVGWLAHHPSDVAAIVRAGWRLRRARWWRTAPFLPVPADAYWDFRVSTVNGDDASDVSAEEAVQSARWSVRQRVGR